MPTQGNAQAKDRAIVAYQTGRLARHGLVRCPGVNQARAKKMGGMFDAHGDIKPEVMCRMAAGMGTAHLGSGLCCFCEKRKGIRGEAATIARNHLHALQQHNPFSYRDIERWMDDAQKEGRAFAEAYDIEAEIGVLRASIQEILTLCRLGEREDHPVIAALDKLTAELGAKEFVDPEQGQVIKDLLEQCRDQCRSPLTEKGKMGPVPMSDATRFDLIRKLAATVSAVARVKLSMDAEANVSVVDLKIWTGQIVALTKRVLADAPDKLLAWAKAVAALPPPRTKQDSVRVDI